MPDRRDDIWLAFSAYRFGGDDSCISRGEIGRFASLCRRRFARVRFAMLVYPAALILKSRDKLP